MVEIDKKVIPIFGECPWYVFSKRGEYIKRKRKEADLSRKELASAVGISYSYLSRLENDQRDYELPRRKVEKFIEALNLDPFEAFSTLCIPLDVRKIGGILLHTAVTKDTIQKLDENFRQQLIYPFRDDKFAVFMYETEPPIYTYFDGKSREKLAVMVLMSIEMFKIKYITEKTLVRDVIDYYKKIRLKEVATLWGINFFSEGKIDEVGSFMLEEDPRPPFIRRVPKERKGELPYKNLEQKLLEINIKIENMTFGDYIIRWRKKNNFSREDLGKIVNVKPSYVKLLELVTDQYDEHEYEELSNEGIKIIDPNIKFKLAWALTMYP